MNRLDDLMDLEAARTRARTKGELVWHYTSLDTLIRVLDSNMLLATEVSFQNDIRETVTADAAFRDAVASLEKEPAHSDFARSVRRFLDDVDEGLTRGRLLRTERSLTDNARFILCASDEPDHLYAWRTYANGGIGCAIGLDPAIPLGVVAPDRAGTKHRVRHWRRVAYSAAETRRHALTMLTKLSAQWSEEHSRGAADQGDMAFALIIEHVEEFRSNIRAIAKDPSFADEREQRVTIDGVPYPAAVISTPSSMGPRPHLRLARTTTWGETVADAAGAQKLPIRGIRLGPNAPESAIVALRWALITHGYLIDGLPEGPDDWRESWQDSVIIDRSEHPYRAA